MFAKTLFPEPSRVEMDEVYAQSPLGFRVNVACFRILPSGLG